MSTEMTVQIRPAETTTNEDDWRGYRVFGPDGFVGTVEECVGALAGGPDELRIRSGLFIPFRQAIWLGDVDRVSHPARRLALRSCATLDPASGKDPRIVPAGIATAKRRSDQR